MKSIEFRSRPALALLALLVLGIMALTLTPTDSSTEAAFECIICGERGLADVILNIIMFMPVGILAVLAFGMTPAIVVGAAFFSAGVEAAQFFIPGRDASLGDLLFNTTGALLGLFVVAVAAHWIRPRARLLPVFAGAATVLCLCAVFATGQLVRPVFSDLTWYALHTPDLPHLEPYDGVVTEATVGDVALRGISRLPREERDTLRTLLAGGAEVRVRLVAGTPPPGVGAFVTIYDEFRQEMLLVGADEDDLVLRMRVLAENLRLDKPFPRLRDALAAYAPGDTLEVSGRFDAGTWCLGVAGEETCGIGMDASNGWRLLYSARGFPRWMHVLASLVWMALLAGLPGFYARTIPTTVLGAAGTLAAFLVVPALDPFLIATPLAALLAGLAGFVAASALGRRVGLRAGAATS